MNPRRPSAIAPARCRAILAAAACALPLLLARQSVAQHPRGGDDSAGEGGGGPRELVWNPTTPTPEWNTSPAVLNWLNNGSLTFFANGDSATFGQIGVGSVIIDGAGVLPFLTHVNNGTGSYFFTGGPILGNGELIKSGGGTLILAGSFNAYSGGTQLNGGVLEISSDEALGAGTSALSFGGGAIRLAAPVTSQRPVNVGPGGGTFDVGSFTASFTGPIGGPGELTKAGPGTLIARNVRTGSLTVGAGELEIESSPVSNGPGGISRLDTLRIAGGPLAPTARLDLSNNGLIVSNVPDGPAGGGGPDAGALENTQGYLNNGFAGGGWTGNGITSGTAADGEGPRAVGYATAASVGIVEFGGFPVAPDDIVLKYTRYGDANLDLVVNLTDFNRLAANFGSTSAFWAQGDFNYDRVVNLADFNLLAANFGLSAGADGVVDPEDWANLASAIPEPGSAAGILVSSLALLRRRRRTI